MTTLNIVTLLTLLAALGYVALASRRLDVHLGALLEQQGRRLRCVEDDLQTARASLEEMKTGAKLRGRT